MLFLSNIESYFGYQWGLSGVDKITKTVYNLYIPHHIPHCNIQA